MVVLNDFRVVNTVTLEDYYCVWCCRLRFRAHVCSSHSALVVRLLVGFWRFLGFGVASSIFQRRVEAGVKRYGFSSRLVFVWLLHAYPSICVVGCVGYRN